MELKKYQKKVISDLKRYMELLQQTHSADKAYNAFWNEQNVMVGGISGMQPYRSNVPNAAEVCFKVPTGGGKTFLACNAVKTIFDFVNTPTKAVVWLVPSIAILEQTINALSNPYHPYRQKLDIDFGTRVDVYSKEQLLNGQNFNPTSVKEQLSIFVLTYDSFRAKNLTKHKAYQENGNLSSFAKQTINSGVLLDTFDETALIQVIRSLNPVMIIDESHHTETTLSQEMKANFNPSFVLELTATPKPDSNIISFVDASSLKRENMVKIPIIVYNRQSQDDVISDAITMRSKLEATAIKEREKGGKYIRPIVLFQAQPRVGTESTTFDKIKKILIDIGIPKEQIAVKTSEINDLKNVNLLSEDCPIRYIITVNALQEGWDCPFAYVLATIANKTSTVDVEQILGRVLRLPNTHKNSNPTLNVSYVLTSSNNFHATLENVVKGLNNAGFSEKDCRYKEEVAEPKITATAQISVEDIIDNHDDDLIDIPAINIENIMSKVDSTVSEDLDDEALQSDEFFSIAIQENEAYEVQLQKEEATELNMVSSEVRTKMAEYRVCEEYVEEIAELQLPQFVQNIGFNIFSESAYELLRSEHLSKGFTLKDKDIIINFNTREADIASVDIDDKANATPKIGKLKRFDSAYFNEMITSQPTEKRLSFCKSLVKTHLSKIDLINDRDLEEYLDRIIENMTSEQLAEFQQAPYPYIVKIKEKVQNLLAAHCEATFKLWLEQGIVECIPTYKFPTAISPMDVIKSLSKSLYTAEENVNNYEFKVLSELSQFDNVRWWHRNISKRGFAINGSINAYPDIIVMTEKGNVVLVETKGDHLDGGKSKVKAETGALWAEHAGRKYRYYMVFEDADPGYRGACTFSKFLEIVKGL